MAFAAQAPGFRPTAPADPTGLALSGICICDSGASKGDSPGKASPASREHCAQGEPPAGDAASRGLQGDGPPQWSLRHPPTMLRPHDQTDRLGLLILCAHPRLRHRPPKPPTSAAFSSPSVFKKQNALPQRDETDTTGRLLLADQHPCPARRCSALLSLGSPARPPSSACWGLAGAPPFSRPARVAPSDASRVRPGALATGAGRRSLGPSGP